MRVAVIDDIERFARGCGTVLLLVAVCVFTGGIFAVEVRPAMPDSRRKVHDRYAPGLHHLAFHAESRAAVDEVHARVAEAGGKVLDPPADYSERQGYTEGYYAVFFADPDGVKLEVVYEPLTNP